MPVTNDVLLSLSRFSNKARRSIGTINVDTLAKNRVYQDMVFALVLETGESELIKLADDLKLKLQTAEKEARVA